MEMKGGKRIPFASLTADLPACHSEEVAEATDEESRTGLSFDLGIVGGGPAGTAAALEARRAGLRVVLWERDRFPRDKVCGEFLSPESIAYLTQVIPHTLVRAAFIHRAEFVAVSGSMLSFGFSPPARGLSRLLLDEALWKAAASAGAEMREHCGVRRVSRSGSHGQRLPDGEPLLWQIESLPTSDDGQMATDHVRALLVACGRWWAFEGVPSPAREDKNASAGPWIGAKAHFRGIAPRDAVEMYYFPGGYCGLAPIEDGMCNACCLVHQSVLRERRLPPLSDFAEWLGATTRHPVLIDRLRGSTQVSATLATAPLRPARRHPVSPRGSSILMLGDAAGFLDPFTGDGISVALHSGRLAAEELAKAWPTATEGHLLRAEPHDFADHDWQRRAAAQYRRGMTHAVRRSYLLAGLLRGLVRAPASVQRSVATVLGSFAPRLLAGTRWRPMRG